MTKSVRDFDNDLRACVDLVSSPWSDWVDGAAWAIIRQSFTYEGQYRRYRQRLETKIIERFFAPSSDLAWHARRGYTYTNHPVHAFTALRETAALRHISDAELCAAIKEHHHYADADRPTILNGKRMAREAPPRVSTRDIRDTLQRRFGLCCMSCDRLVLKDDYEHVPWHQQWEPHGICDDCVLSLRRNSATRAMVDEAQARKFRAIKTEQNSRREAGREVASVAYRQQKEQRRIARERKRVEMRAAYELVRELGLLDQIQTDQKGEMDETRTTH